MAMPVLAIVAGAAAGGAAGRSGTAGAEGAKKPKITSNESIIISSLYPKTNINQGVVLSMAVYRRLCHARPLANYPVAV